MLALCISLLYNYSDSSERAELGGCRVVVWGFCEMKCSVVAFILCLATFCRGGGEFFLNYITVIIIIIKDNIY